MVAVAFLCPSMEVGQRTLTAAWTEMQIGKTYNVEIQVCGVTKRVDAPNTGIFKMAAYC